MRFKITGTPPTCILRVSRNLNASALTSSRVMRDNSSRNFGPDMAMPYHYSVWFSWVTVSGKVFAKKQPLSPKAKLVRDWIISVSDYPVD